MSANLEKAKALLESGGFTLAAVNGDKEITSVQRGVKLLLELLDEKTELCGYSAADKVVGKAAAFLYVLLKPDELYAAVISKPALDTLDRFGVKVRYDTLVKAIRNRDNTGFCPMETAVMNANDPNDALLLIREKLKSMNSNK